MALLQQALADSVHLKCVLTVMQLLATAMFSLLTTDSSAQG